MPCIHAPSHNLKEVASRHKVRLVFFQPLISCKNFVLTSMQQQGCTIMSLPLQSARPLSRENIYIGQTERCLNKGEDKHVHM